MLAHANSNENNGFVLQQFAHFAFRRTRLVKPSKQIPQENAFAFSQKFLNRCWDALFKA